jgi:CO dehydrogenase maturation factor
VAEESTPPDIATSTFMGPFAFSAGLPQQEHLLPDEAVEERPEGEDGPRYRLREDPLTSVERYAATGPDGFRYLQLGKVGGGSTTGRDGDAAATGEQTDGTSPRSLPAAGGALLLPRVERPDARRGQHAFRLISAGLQDAPHHLVGDLPGGTRQPFFGWARWARLVLVVAEPGSASLLSARRLARLGRMEGGPRMLGVANLVDDLADARLVERRTGLELGAVIPRDPAVAAAERRGVAPIDHDPHSPAVEAVRSLLSTVRSMEVGA